MTLDCQTLVFAWFVNRDFVIHFLSPISPSL